MPSFRPLRSIVTGGSGALGSAIVRSLCERGDQVVCLDQHAPATCMAEFVKVDVTQRPSVDRAIRHAVEHMGGLDVLVHAAGMIRAARFSDLTEEDFECHLNTNLLGAFRVAQQASIHMMENGGRIVFITSIHGQIGVTGRSAYAASKGAVASLARVMAAELAKHRIRVNVLAPGAVDGGMMPDPKSRDGWIAATPSDRVAYLEEVAAVAAMLASDEASFVNGQVLAVDGGASTVRSIGR
ncbi:SDR family NAD(P)-dependent oxidoreductase [Roseibium porphyridii]|uniref:SDR family NAD(P)-dependent oxidoreductase n=1 Tax=Roseibium porphyridii TaxID=2866279 RepID=A0ABY8F9P5_9HYPH|nr:MULTISPECIES: SDR family oxidoreductase [Stappiaceae]WFE91941.1 SDR family NAD(P)-dependent oxidoreductase [Roseibium sp. KMA01]